MSTDDLSNIPVAPPPPGQMSNFVDPPSLAWIPRLAIYTTLPVAIIAVMLRLGARFQQRQVLRWEDYFCIAALFAIIGYSVALLVMLADGVLGRHVWDIPVNKIGPDLFKLTFAITLFWTLASLLIKLSFLVLFYRLFSPNKFSRIMTIVGIVFVAVSYSILAAAWTYYAVPHIGETGWLDLEYVNRERLSAPQVTLTLGSVGVFTDLYILIIPLISIYGLNLSRPKKFGVLALFATGSLACALSIAGQVVRVYYYHGAVFENGVPDSLWVGMKPYGLTVAEIDLGIVCACVPVAFPLLKGIANKLASIRSENSEPRKGTTRGDNWRLSTIPKVALDSLLSFTRGHDRVRPSDSQTILVTRTTDVEMAPYDIEMIETNYNRFISSDYIGSRPSLVGSAVYTKTRTGGLTDFSQDSH